MGKGPLLDVLLRTRVNTVRELARRAGLSDVLLRKCIYGERAVTMRTAERVARVLRIEPAIVAQLLCRGEVRA